MKKLIEESGLKIREFAELYNIPYNTVRQWYNEERKCPEYIKSLILQIRKLKSKGSQLELPLNELRKKEDEPITREGIEKTINVFEYIIYYKGQNNAFIKVPKDLLIEQFIALSK